MFDIQRDFELDGLTRSRGLEARQKGDVLLMQQRQL